MSALDVIKRRGALARGLVADRSPDQSVAERGLQRVRVLLAALGNPHLAYRTIHVAGSKGKGTATHVAAAMLSALGYTAGRYTSPHLLAWNERIAVNGDSISDSAFDRISGKVDQIMAELESRQPDLGSYNSFELLTAIAFVHFRERRCDIAVIEVGLGGRFDSTNTVEPVATVITRIEAEHIETLGPTLQKVAWNKAGVIKENVPVVVTHQRTEVDAVITAEAVARSAPLYREGQEWSTEESSGRVRYRFGAEPMIDLVTTLPGAHNAGNIGAAATAVRFAIDNQPLPETTISDAIAKLVIPGRFERRTDPESGHDLILDGAHTPESISALVETAASEYGVRSFPMIIGVLSDKPAIQMLAALASHAGQIIFPESANPRAVAPYELQKLAANLGLQSSTAPSVRAALAVLRPGPAPILVTGSFGIVAECLRAILPAPLSAS